MLLRAILLVSFLVSANAFADTGVVKWYSQTTSYGFIIPDVGTRDIFFHGYNVVFEMEEASLAEGMCVTYDLARNRNFAGKVQAVNVQLCN